MKNTNNNDKLLEIEIAATQQIPGFSLDDFDISNAKQVATGEGGMPILKSTAIKDSSLIMYSFVEDKTFIASVIGKMHDNYFVVGWSWVDSAYRCKGYITALYAALNQKLHLSLLSDFVQSPEMKSVWDKLPMKQVVHDNETGEKIERSQFDSNQLYDGNHRYRLMIESIEPPKYNPQTGAGIPSVLKEGILKDYIKYTAIENKGNFL